MCNLQWCYTFCTGVTLFALVLQLNCTALSQSESSNFFMYIIKAEMLHFISVLNILGVVRSLIFCLRKKCKYLKLLSKTVFIVHRGVR